MKNDTQKLLLKAKEKGISKWEIAKKIGIHWNSVRFWERGIFKPTEENMAKLKEIING